ncbi:hypothetical protein HK102_003735 [Quaeritorhiza haematococci]|nr:hypothetical protein HK102_003735 [Quaeritorhiza haematococci]
MVKSADGYKYSTASSVLMVEVVKFIACVFVVAYYRGNQRSFFTDFVSGFNRDTLLLALPAGTYAVQSNLLYIGISNLTPTTYQVVGQSKIPITALLSVIILKTRINMLKWFSLFVLVVGILMIMQDPYSIHQPHQPQPQPSNITTTTPQLSVPGQQQFLESGFLKMASPNTTYPANSGALSVQTQLSAEYQSRFIGVAAVILASLSSSFAGVFFEKLMKGADDSLSKSATMFAKAKQESFVSQPSRSEKDSNSIQPAWTQPSERKVLIDDDELAPSTPSKPTPVIRKCPILIVQNMYLGLFGVLFSALYVVLDAQGGLNVIMSPKKLLRGYTVWTWLVIFNQALGGLIIAGSIKYADNILKTL